MVPSVLKGAAHYPELWPVEVFHKDLELMKEIKLNVVRVAEFTWSLLEPEEGRYSFDWLHEYIDAYRKHGIRVVIGTPTAAPPPWLVKKHPEILPIDYNGVPARYGVRREYCPNNPLYREFTKKIVSKLAEEFKDYDNVIGFQIDNEVHWGEGSSWRYCYCPHCISKFREYLEGKYGDIENLNKTMGTLVWSHKYSSYDEIVPPKPPFDLYNRSLTIEWLRFRSQSWVDYVNLQAEIIRSVAPGKLVTTNLMGLYPEIDYYRLSGNLDFSSTDVYPKFGSDAYDPAYTGLVYDATRNMSRNRRFVVMELQAGATDGYSYVAPEGSGVFKISVTPEPGEIRKWAYQAIAHGAEGVLFWDWRTRPIGKEQFWHGILDHDGVPRRRFREVQKLFNELDRISDVIDKSRVEASAALLLSYETLWALDTIEKGYYNHTYTGELAKTYKALWLNRVNIDVIPPEATFDSYKIVAAPSLYLASQTLIEKLREYVHNGGTLLLTPRSFVKDEYNRVNINLDKVYELTGVKIKEYTRLPENAKASIKFEEDSPILAKEETYGEAWLETYEPETAKPIAYATWRWMRAEPVITVNNYGKGTVVTIGSILPQHTLTKIIKQLLQHVNIKPVIQENTLDPNIEYYSKTLNTRKKVLFIINHEGTPKQLKIKLAIDAAQVTELLTGQTVKPVEVEHTLNPHDVKILLIE